MKLLESESRRTRLKVAIAGATAVAVASSVAVAISGGAAGAATVHGLGAIVPTEKISASTTLGVGAVGALPASVDLAAWAPPVGDQGAVGSCVAWATAYGLMGWQARKAGITSTDFAPMYMYSQIHLDNSADGGGSIPSAALGLVTSQGNDTRAHYTQGDFDFTTLPTTSEKTNAARFKITSTTTLFSGSNQGAAGQTAIQNALAAGQPVAFALPVRKGFDNITAASPIDNDTTTTSRGNHEVMAIGYDANGLHFQNQWGTGWGASGRGYVSWNVVQKDLFFAATLSGFAGIPAKGTVWFAKTSGTASGKVEVNSATASAYSGGVSAKPTRFSTADGANGVFQMVGSDLYFIKTKNTALGVVEVHTATAASSYLSGTDSVTGISSADGASGTVQMAAGDLWLAKTSGTASGKVEVSRWPASLGFLIPSVLTATVYTTADAPNGVFQIQGTDLIFLKTKNTTSGRVEYKRATASSNYLTLSVNTKTAFSTADAGNGWFSTEDVDGDAVADMAFIKTLNTGNTSVQYILANGARKYQQKTSTVNTWIPNTNAAKGQFQVNSKQ